MTKTRKFSKSKKSTAIKVSNKNFNRNLKSGKFKLRKNKLPKNLINGSERNEDPSHQESDAESANDSAVSVDDVQMLKTFSKFSINNKRKNEDDYNDSALHEYEKIPRHSFKQKKMKYLLPLKDASGLIPQSIELQENTGNYENNTDGSYFISTSTTGTPKTEESEKTFVELCAERQQKLKHLKEKVGFLCTSITENPEQNVRMCKELLLLLDNNDPSIYLSLRKLVCLSLVEVFKDVLPAYKIRSMSEKELGKKLKKETKQLREYESSILRYYKQFLVKLEKMLECLKSKYRTKFPERASDAKTKAKHVLAGIALSSFAELLLSHPNFNFSNIIIKIIVDKMAHKNPEISRICCDTISKLFQGDRVGECSLECVKFIKKLVKSRNFNIQTQVLHTFVFLNVKEAERETDDSKRKDPKKAKMEAQMMSKKEKKRQKKLKDLQNELLEAEAVETKAKKSRFHTQILNEVFLIYFSILKGDFSISLFTPVLEGLAKFAHLINIDYFDDLIHVLYKILESDKLGFTETLHCLKSVFTILSGQGESLNIDPQGFYGHLYKCLMQVNLGLSDDKVLLLLQCIDLMIIQRRKKITQQRVFAFLKRISTILLFQSSHVTLAFLTLIRQLFINFKQCDILLDAENTGSGLYNPELEDPEYCHASSTVLWEMHQLTHSHHPLVTKYAQHLLLRCPTQGSGQLHPSLALKPPSEILKMFREERSVNFSLIRKPVQPNRNSNVKKFHPCVVDGNSVTSKALTLAQELM